MKPYYVILCKIHNYRILQPVVLLVYTMLMGPFFLFFSGFRAHCYRSVSISFLCLNICRFLKFMADKKKIKKNKTMTEATKLWVDSVHDLTWEIFRFFFWFPSLSSTINLLYRTPLGSGPWSKTIYHYKEKIDCRKWIACCFFW